MMSEVFMVYVEGRSRPRVRHATLELATEEAKRLAALPDVKRRVFVMADVAVFDKPQPAKPAAPVVIIKKKRLTLPPS